MPSSATRTRRSILGALLLIALASGCGRQLRSVELEPMSFVSPHPPIAGAVEVCVRKKLHARHWNVAEHPYRIELGKRAALNFERMVRAAFRDVIVAYTEDCGSLSDRPWIEATIVSANRDWDGLEGLIDPEPVDTALTLALALQADDGSPIWSTEITARHRATDFGLVGPTIRSQRGSRDFGIVLSSALDQGFEALVTSREVRAAFGDAAGARDDTTAEAR